MVLKGPLVYIKPYRPSKNGDEEFFLDGQLQFVTPDEYDYICELPEDEVDNALTSILNLEGEAARYWTKRY